MSDWKQSAAKRRDARATKTPEAEEYKVSASKKKDTKRWCRGKVGREHVGKCVPYAETKRAPTDWCGKKIGLFKGWYLLICTSCGKELARHFPWHRTDAPPPPTPPWVTP